MAAQNANDELSELRIVSPDDEKIIAAAKWTPRLELACEGKRCLLLGGHQIATNTIMVWCTCGAADCDHPDGSRLMALDSWVIEHCRGEDLAKYEDADEDEEGGGGMRGGRGGRGSRGARGSGGGGSRSEMAGGDGDDVTVAETGMDTREDDGEEVGMEVDGEDEEDDMLEEHLDDADNIDDEDDALTNATGGEGGGTQDGGGSEGAGGRRVTFA